MLLRTVVIGLTSASMGISCSMDSILPKGSRYTLLGLSCVSFPMQNRGFDLSWRIVDAMFASIGSSMITHDFGITNQNASCHLGRLINNDQYVRSHEKGDGLQFWFAINCPNGCQFHDGWRARSTISALNIDLCCLCEDSYN